MKLTRAPCPPWPLSLLLPSFAGEPRRRPRIAVIYTMCYHRSHAHVILENFLTPFLFNGKITQPAVDVVSLYADQRPRSKTLPDLTDDIVRRFKLPLYRTIGEALTLGGKELAVDAVLAIGEHGDYAANRLGVREYPRKRFFDEIVAVMRRSNRFVPIFNDKHLSYRWDWAREMYDTAQKHRIPFMAGSSVPLAQRRQPEFAPGAAHANCVIEEGRQHPRRPVPGFTISTLSKVLQAFIEMRKGGETGIREVEFLPRKARSSKPAGRDAGRWILAPGGDARRVAATREIPDLEPTRSMAWSRGASCSTYRDGTKASVLRLGNYNGIRWNFAAKIAGEHANRA